MKPDKSVDKAYQLPAFIAKLRRLADALESGKNFGTEIAGERVFAPSRAVCSIKHEREEGFEEVEFQTRW